MTPESADGCQVTCRVVGPSAEFVGKQALWYASGISAESVGAQAIHLQVVLAVARFVDDRLFIPASTIY